jgi:hypothetical protein
VWAVLWGFLCQCAGKTNDLNPKPHTTMLAIYSRTIPFPPSLLYSFAPNHLRRRAEHAQREKLDQDAAALELALCDLEH